MKAPVKCPNCRSVLQQEEVSERFRELAVTTLHSLKEALRVRQDGDQ